VILDVRGLQKYYPVRKSFLSSSSDVVHAVEDISFQIRAGETFSLVGETGSGKSTVASMIMRLIEPTAGEIEFDGKNMLTQNRKELRETRRDIQMIFQDPYASLNPRMTVESTVGLPLEQLKISSGKEKRQRVIQLLETVGLKPAEKILDRFPHEFSGGQKQRIGVARALALSPKFIVADEPVSSLDISIRAQILNLLKDLKERYNLTYLLIAHDLSVVKYMSDWVCIMYLGRGMELARVKEFYKKPLHPYTKSLLSAVPPIHPSIEKKRIKLKGEMPSAINPPSGCLFHTRCPYTEEKCININPNFMEIRPGHWVSCHRWDEI
jgi:oligopeptide/dipeptide ABC transporter ATP-binding protein|tara:strand:+ start:71 stop:1042 length:972 start_codon:yes stop_codon:yes gene_type:complete